jgi:ribosomal protein S12 methylthiotransferase accessory factor
MKYALIKDLLQNRPKTDFSTTGAGLSVLSYIASALSIDLFAAVKDSPEESAREDFLSRFARLKQYGIATETGEYPMYPDEPQGFITTVKLSQRRSFGYAGRGVDMFERAATYMPAIGESVERWATAFFVPPPREVIETSYAELKKPKVDIFSFAGFSEEKRREKPFGHSLVFSADTVFEWVPARSLLDNSEVYVPLQTVSFAPMRRKEGREPLIAPAITTGAAAGGTHTDAVLGGLLEIIERDAFMIHWLNQTTPDRIDLSTVPDERVRRLIDVAARYRLELYPLHLRTDAPAHTVACVCIDRSGVGPAVTIGMSAHLSLAEAIYKGVGEVLATRSPSRRRVEQNKSGIPDKAHAGHLSRLFYWSPLEKIHDISPWISGPIKPFHTFPKYKEDGTTKEKLVNLLEFFRKEQYVVVVKEILPKHLQRKFGMTVVFVKVPEFQPLFVDEPFACTRGKRLTDIPKKLNMKTRTPGGSCTEPHPFL